MKKINKKECEDKLLKALNDNYNNSNVKIKKIEERDKGKSKHFDYLIEVSQMYEYVDFGFEFLEFISKMFNTKQINFEHGDHYDGCETCNYGSRYTVSLYVKKSDVEVKEDEKK